MKHPSPSVRKFISETGVSRETIERLGIYHDLLLKWQPKINLVSPSTVAAAWERHFLDSMQLFSLLSDSDKSIFDLGSGAGFPGLVLSIMGATQVNLVESDQRKCVFLSEVIRKTSSTAKVWNTRIETLAQDGTAHYVTSRACASLDSLLSYAQPLLQPEGECLFLKGRLAQQEIEEAQKNWVFHVEHWPSRTDNEGCILRIRDLVKRAKS